MPILDTALLILGAIGWRELLAAGIPKAIEAWRKSRESDAEVEVARARVAEREASQRIETRRAHVEGLGVAERMLLDRAGELRSREAEHAAERAGHRACLERCSTLERRVGEETSARQALERVVLWLLERVGLDHESPPDDVAKTLDRIRPTTPPIAPEPAE